MLTVSEQPSFWWLLTFADIEPVTFLSPLCYWVNSSTPGPPCHLRKPKRWMLRSIFVPLSCFFFCPYNGCSFPWFTHFSGGFIPESRTRSKFTGKQTLFFNFLVRNQTLRGDKWAETCVVCTPHPWNGKCALFLLHQGWWGSAGTVRRETEDLANIPFHPHRSVV